jgi:hypothetical protein
VIRHRDLGAAMNIAFNYQLTVIEGTRDDLPLAHDRSYAMRLLAAEKQRRLEEERQRIAAFNLNN